MSAAVPTISPAASGYGMRPRRPAGLATQSMLLTGRALRALQRNPAVLAFTLIQPVIWLLLFGQLFRSVVHLPGFHAVAGSSYLAFLTPGVIVMTALFSSGWAGTAYIEDMNLGVMDRLLASPARRTAMVVANLGYQAVTTTVQTLIVFAIAYAAGARFPSPGTGIPVTVVAAVLVAVIIAAFSDAIALLVRQQEALIGISQFVVLPLQFLSGAIMDLHLAPAWIRDVARFNFVDWAVVASRDALSASVAWETVLWRLGLLTGLAVVMAVLATRAFRAYQRHL
ncbi:MAG TPA: ABC transporter permease [Mycobacteriales bacterium]|nr:ABC transporter permease [Mycobacteriales bacterium]